MTPDFEFRPGGQRFDLAQAPDFDLGAVRVSPAHRRVTRGARSWDLEPRVMRVLVALAAASPRVLSREQLTETCWDGRIVSDDAVNRCILSLRNLARSQAPELFHIETVRGVGYSLLASASDELASDNGAGATSRNAGWPWPRRMLVILAMLAVIVAGAFWAGWRSLHPSSDASSMARVEVASFPSLRADDPELARVSHGARGALVRVLGSADIPVVESTAADKTASPDADFHLQGSVDRDTDALVINAQMRDRRGRDVLWSGRFERPLSDVARFPDQVASQMGDMIHCALSSRASSNRLMTDAVLSLMLRACELRRVGSPEEAPKFLAAAERLRAAAPRLSVAQSMYALAAAAKSALVSDAPDAPALAATARAAAHRALQLDPKNGEAYLAIGISYGFDRAWDERDANFQRAEALSHGFSVVRDLHVGLLREVGRLRDARELNQRTVADDPLSPDQLTTLAILTAAADGVGAVDPILQRLRLMASPEQSDDVRLTATLWWGDPRTAAALLARMRGGPDAPNTACFRAYLSRLERPAPRRGLPDSCAALQSDWRVRLLAREGDIDGAYAEIAKAPGGTSALIALYYPEMRAFRADPRFMPLAARFGLVDYWTRTGHWPDFCTAPDRPYDCAAVARALPKGV